MGCDIHMFTEMKVNEEWVNIDYFIRNNNYGKADYEPEYEMIPIVYRRHYALFAMLANVRNDSNNEYISNPKGLPVDCCKYISDNSKSLESDGHSHSYLTLEELITFAKDHKYTKYSGLMTEANAKLVDAGEMPQMWCKATNAPNMVYREWQYENNILQPIISELTKRKEDMKYQYICDVTDSDIRIVFWFDN